MAKLVNLPEDILHRILRHAFLIRGVKRGLRLRLVNKLFASQIWTTIHLFALLDPYLTRSLLHSSFESSPLAPSYLVQRTIHPSPFRAGRSPLPALARLDEVCRILEEHSNSSVAVTYSGLRNFSSPTGSLDTRKSPSTNSAAHFAALLAPLVLRNFGQHVFSAFLSALNDLETDVYIAALYVGEMGLVSKWMRHWRGMDQYSRLFGLALDHAAERAGVEVLAAMLKEGDVRQQKGVWLYLLGRAGEAGREEMVEFVYEFGYKSREKRRGDGGGGSEEEEEVDEALLLQAHPSSSPPLPLLSSYQTDSSNASTLLVQQYIDRVAKEQEEHQQEQDNGKYILSPEEEEYLRSVHLPTRKLYHFFHARWPRKQDRETCTAALIHCAAKGWAEMAEFYITLGAWTETDLVEHSSSSLTTSNQRTIPNPSSSPSSLPPLSLACLNNHLSLLPLLIQHTTSIPPSALLSAITSHNPDTVRTLLAHFPSSSSSSSTSISHLPSTCELLSALSSAPLSILRLIISHPSLAGSGIQYAAQGLLVDAVRREDEGMFGYIVEQSGGVVDREYLDRCKEVARKERLESMMELVERVVVV